MIAIPFAALGMTLGSMIKDMEGLNLASNFLVMPMFFLSGALYPLSHLSTVLSVITHIDPLSYGVDGLRGTLVGVWHFSYSLDSFLLCSLAAIFLGTGAYFFSKIEI
jgi:ABC-2 type transport system permease protein